MSRIITTTEVLETVAVECEMDYRGDYSGRRMYGTQCPAFTDADGNAITPDAQIVARLALAIIMEQRDCRDDEVTALDIIDMVGEIWYETDALGRGSVIYFRNLEIQDEE